MTDDSLLKFKLQASLKRCSPTAYPPALPAIDDHVQFGPSDYIMQYYLDPAYKYMKPYYLLTYRSYKITNAKSITWSVDVTKSLAPSGAKTNITSLLMTGLQYSWWTEQCKTTCPPPLKQAINGTICTGVSCTGKASGLDAPDGLNNNEYRLVVAYPIVSSVENVASFSTKPLTSKYNKQMVRTKIYAKEWNLGPPAGRAAVVGEDVVELQPFVALTARQ